jgi:hypothetical protein
LDFSRYWEPGRKILDDVCQSALDEHHRRLAELEKIRTCVKELDAEAQEESMRLVVHID